MALNEFLGHVETHRPLGDPKTQTFMNEMSDEACPPNLSAR